MGKRESGEVICFCFTFKFIGERICSKYPGWESSLIILIRGVYIMVEKSLKDLNLSLLTDRQFFPSPAAWEDEVLYFMMLDRFSDGKEKGYRDNDGNIVNNGTTPLFKPEDADSAVLSEQDAGTWREAGGKWVGGTLKGLTSKIGYIKRLGVTAIWVSPIFKQVSFQETYHGYGIQNFIDVDPNFGTREELKTMIETAHAHGIYVILDIILNHSGNVLSYEPDRYWTKNEGSGEWFLDPRWDGSPYAVKGFNNADGVPDIPFGPIDPAADGDTWPDGAVWPSEFSQNSVYTKKGRINSWDYDPEFIEGDFYDLKDIHLGTGNIEAYQSSSALQYLAEVYKFWIAFADIDGFRIDTVKHMDPGATRFFASVIHEFAQSITKENFYLIGEITGGRTRAVDTMEETGLNAALGIADIPDKLEYLVKGKREPVEYFDLFRNSMLVKKDSHVWFRNKVVTVLDDHDQVRKGNNKARFCADDPGKKLALSVLALNVTTLGIPCIYYGSEQCFDGEGGNDSYIREAMFGGEFGAFRSRDRHLFNEDAHVYKELSKVLSIRKEYIALRRGRQYLREISGDGEHFGLPYMIGDRILSVVPWSRIFNDREMLLAINTDCDDQRTARVIVDNYLNAEDSVFKCIYSTDMNQKGQEITVKRSGSNTTSVSLSVPAAGFVIFKKI